jgi:hypothetical protein
MLRPLNRAPLGPFLTPHLPRVPRKVEMSTGLTEDEIREMLEKLRHQHRNLDYMIDKLEDQGSDMLTIQRLKKRKLQLKDLVARLESMLIPDIIA